VLPSVEGNHRSPFFDLNYQEKYELFIRFADAFMYPNNTAQAADINSTLFSENIQGRVDLTNTFDGQELNTEVGFLYLPLRLTFCSTFLGCFRR